MALGRNNRDARRSAVPKRVLRCSCPRQRKYFLHSSGTYRTPEGCADGIRPSTLTDPTTRYIGLRRPQGSVSTDRNLTLHLIRYAPAKGGWFVWRRRLRLYGAGRGRLLIDWLISTFNSTRSIRQRTCTKSHVNLNRGTLAKLIRYFVISTKYDNKQCIVEKARGISKRYMVQRKLTLKTRDTRSPYDQVRRVVLV